MSHSEGYSDEAALGAHDLIHNAEVEEQKAHGSHALTQPDFGEGEAGAGTESTSTGDQPQQQQPQQQGQQQEGQQQQEQPKKEKQEKHGKHHSTMEKVKEALHIKK